MQLFSSRGKKNLKCSEFLGALPHNTSGHNSTNHSTGEKYCGSITPGQCMQSAVIAASVLAGNKIVTWIGQERGGRWLHALTEFRPRRRHRGLNARRPNSESFSRHAEGDQGFSDVKASESGLRAVNQPGRPVHHTGGLSAKERKKVPCTAKALNCRRRRSLGGCSRQTENYRR